MLETVFYKDPKIKYFLVVIPKTFHQEPPLLEFLDYTSMLKNPGNHFHSVSLINIDRCGALMFVGKLLSI